MLPTEKGCSGAAAAVLGVCFSFSAMALALESASLKLTEDSLFVSEGGGGTAE